MAKESKDSSNGDHGNRSHKHSSTGERNSSGERISNDTNSHSSQPQSSGVNNQSARYKKVFIQRDYSHGTAVRFSSTFPVELEGYIDPESFQYLINHVNLMYGQGEKMSSRTFCESCCACLTAYCMYMCIESYYDKCARKVGDFIAEQNDLRWKRRGLLITDPLERGLRVIEITIYLDKAEGVRSQSQSATHSALGLTSSSGGAVAVTSSGGGGGGHAMTRSSQISAT